MSRIIICSVSVLLAISLMVPAASGSSGTDEFTEKTDFLKGITTEHARGAPSGGKGSTAVVEWAEKEMCVYIAFS